MTLDATKPSDSANTIDELGYFERETRAAVNALEVMIGTLGALTLQTTLLLSAGTTQLRIPTDLSPGAEEIVFLSAGGASQIASILGGVKGQRKIIALDDANVTFLDTNALVGNVLNLNQTPRGGTFGSIGDVVAFACFGTFWREIWRIPSNI